MHGLFHSLSRRLLRLPLMGAALLAGCATTPSGPQPGSLPHAQLVLVNLAARTWEISFSPSQGGEVRTEHVPRQATRTVALAGGDYTVAQVLQGAAGSHLAARRLVVRFEAGRVYRWPLAVLEPEATTTPADGGAGGAR